MEYFYHAPLKINRCCSGGILMSLTAGHLVLIKLLDAGSETEVKSHVECLSMSPIQTQWHRKA